MVSWYIFPVFGMPCNKKTGHTAATKKYEIDLVVFIYHLDHHLPVNRSFERVGACIQGNSIWRFCYKKALLRDSQGK
jgi:hypothetical protein